MWQRRGNLVVVMSSDGCMQVNVMYGDKEIDSIYVKTTSVPLKFPAIEPYLKLALRSNSSSKSNPSKLVLFAHIGQYPTKPF